MLRPATILYCFAWILYAVFTVVAFPLWDISVAIPSILLLGLGAWIYGTNRGMIIIVPTLLFHIILFSHIHEDIFTCYQVKASGPIIQIIVVGLIGNLKKELDRIKATNDRLDHLINTRNTELDYLTTRLLKNSESMKIAYGQRLHDGIGQQLTGIQLLSSTLSEYLLVENNPAAAISHRLRIQANQTHHHIRIISRQLFPVRIGQVGLIAALDELSSCMNDIKPVKIMMNESNELPFLPEHLQLQLFRICQETTLHLTDHLQADRIFICITTDRSTISITIEHNGIKSATLQNNKVSRLIRYRLNQIKGIEHPSTRNQDKQLSTFSIPLNVMPA